MERLPLSSVRTFAVVARLLSISRAAEELNVTPSAVSHQIRVLEQYLGTSLFRRAKNKISLTPAGQQYMGQVSEGLLLLSRATMTIKAEPRQQVLRIGAPPSLASLWLVDRLPRFMKSSPEIAVAVTAVPDPLQLLHGSFDVAFWYGHKLSPGLSVDPLGKNRIFPICKPQLLRGEHALRSPADLARYTLLDSSDEAFYENRETRPPDWNAWLQLAGQPEVTGSRCLSFTPRNLMHRAVLADLGVGLSRSLIAVDALARREIAVPFGPAIAVPMGYNLVFPTHLAKRKDVAAFRSWVLAEVAASMKKLDGMLKHFIEP